VESYISPLVIETLLSADATGLIEIPPGSACEIEDITNDLMALEKMGFLTRPIGSAYYRPFQLTEKGAKLKSTLVKAETVTSQAA